MDVRLGITEEAIHNEEEMEQKNENLLCRIRREISDGGDEDYDTRNTEAT